MPSLVWDKVGSRSYETGLDRGILYLPDGSAVPWNGLTSIAEKFDNDSNQIYYDGMKINDLISFGEFSATMNALTYPDELTELEGYGVIRKGMFVGDQVPKTFALCYRTRTGNDLNADLGYKIHILYNVTAIPKDTTHESITSSPSIIEFEWDIVAVPQEIPGFRPTAHIIISSTEVDPELLKDLEEKIYGSDSVDASLIPMADLVSYINDWARVKIIDNYDGTWTADFQVDSELTLDVANQLFTITIANATYLDSDTYEISDTTNLSDV